MFGCFLAGLNLAPSVRLVTTSPLAVYLLLVLPSLWLQRFSHATILAGMFGRVLRLYKELMLSSSMIVCLALAASM